MPIIPSPPGQSRLPPGRARRFHVTTAQKLAAIREEGLRFDQARGIEGPKAIWSWPSWQEAARYAGWPSRPDLVVVEFHESPDAHDANPYAAQTSVPPDAILAIHEPWHDTYRYALDNGLTAADLLEAGYEKAAAAMAEREAEQR